MTFCVLVDGLETDFSRDIVVNVLFAFRSTFSSTLRAPADAKRHGFEQFSSEERNEEVVQFFSGISQYPQVVSTNVLIYPQSPCLIE